MTTQEQIDELVQVWEDPAPRSAYQRNLRDRIVSEWPALGTALENIATRPGIETERDARTS